jgi:5-methylcytosine-specific restriction endonuclease McrA
MIARPCARCGNVIPAGTHCNACQPTEQRKAKPRGHVHTNPAQWKTLSARVRRMQPWCLDCGAVTNLSADHLLPVSDAPELAYAIENLTTRCLSCNGKRSNTFTHDEAHAVLKRLEATYKRCPTRKARERVNVALRLTEGCGVPPSDTAFRPVGKARSALHTPRRCV